MKNKKYSSYAQIDRDLQILKLEKEIDKLKLVKTFDETKQSVVEIPKNLLGIVPNTIFNFLGNNTKTIKGIIISYFLRKIFFKK